MKVEDNGEELSTKEYQEKIDLEEDDVEMKEFDDIVNDIVNDGKEDVLANGNADEHPQDVNVDAGE